MKKLNMTGNAALEQLLAKRQVPVRNASNWEREMNPVAIAQFRDGFYRFTTEGGRELTFTESPATIGTRIWDTCVFMSKYLEMEWGPEKIAGKKILELGSGCGLLGSALVEMGAHVTFTDLAVIQDHLNSNIQRLFPEGKSAAGGTAEVKVLDWITSDLTPFVEYGYDMVVGSDLTAWPLVMPNLAKVFTQVVADPRMQVLVGAVKGREGNAILLEHCEQAFEVTPVSWACPKWPSNRIEVLQFRRKA